MVNLSAAILVLTLTPDPGVVEKALEKAFAWMAAFPAEELRFDAAVGLTAISRMYEHPALAKALGAARRAADRDHDNPMRRFFDRRQRSPRQAVQGWQPPQKGSERVNTNRPVVEALYCDLYPMREATLTYVTGPMTDGGGYHTVHGLWALVLARHNGCLDQKRFEKLAVPLRKQIEGVQPVRLESKKTLQVDLYAERALMLMLSGSSARSDRWAFELIAAQNRDGSFGTAEKGESPYLRFHATMLACWALATWRADVKGCKSRP
jgi:hypothetical protein